VAAVGRWAFVSFGQSLTAATRGGETASCKAPRAGHGDDEKAPRKESSSEGVGRARRVPGGRRGGWVVLVVGGLLE
jgi:hypothetical protein